MLRREDYQPHAPRRRKPPTPCAKEEEIHNPMRQRQAANNTICQVGGNQSLHVQEDTSNLMCQGVEIFYPMHEGGGNQCLVLHYCEVVVIAFLLVGALGGNFLPPWHIRLLASSLAHGVIGFHSLGQWCGWLLLLAAWGC